MRNQFRAIGLAAVSLLLLGGTTLRAEGYYQVQDSQLLLENLIHQSDAMLSELNLTRAGHFHVMPTVLQGLPERSWARDFYGAVLNDPRNPGVALDIQVAKQFHELRAHSLMLYDLWTRFRQPDPRLTQEFVYVNRAFYNATSAGYFYLEVLRRTYVQAGCTGICTSNTLNRRLRNMECLLHEIVQLMSLIRRCNSFQFPLPRQTTLEYARGNVRIHISLDRPGDFVTFPYYAGNRYYVPSDLLQPAAGQPDVYRPSYDLRNWNRRWDYFQQDRSMETPLQQPSYPPQGQQQGYPPSQEGQGYPPPQQGRQGYPPSTGQQPFPAPQPGDQVVPSSDYDT